MVDNSPHQASSSVHAFVVSKESDYIMTLLHPNMFAIAKSSLISKASAAAAKATFGRKTKEAAGNLPS
jgi:hypothetical protein